jgi:predicted peroxiredoxin
MVEHGKRSDNGLVKAFYTGMGFTIFRKGVFDRLEYPWFRPLTHKVGENMDLMGEDVALFYNLYEKGIDLWIDPQVYVGHEKYQVLKPMGEF